MENSSLSAPLIVPDTNEQQQINDKLGHVQHNNIEAAGRRLGNYDANNYSGNTSFFKTCFNGFNALSGCCVKVDLFTNSSKFEIFFRLESAF
ncbi:hypothetical protein WN944_005531 [Citrus x changshan-huyou]|uniref:Uncharacterized protein n=1 Tax=Citrus x changshan-huyou TaxID=2935761 RepID=A0AAP0M734_9ROSI